MPLTEPSIPAVLEDRAQRHLDDIAYSSSTTRWTPRVCRKLDVVAGPPESAGCRREALELGSPGDRAVILAPQSLEYIVAFLGAIQAGFIAVPLPVPLFGTHDERVSGALRDFRRSRY